MARHITFYLIALFVVFNGEHVELHETRNHARPAIARTSR